MRCVRGLRRAGLRAAAEAAGWAVHAVTGLAGDGVPPGALVLDGDSADPAAAQEAAARTIIRNCDLLVALGESARLLLERGWHLAPGPAPEGDAARDGLRANLQAALRRPEADGPPLDARLGIA